MILLTGLYDEPSQSRRAELRECLRRNAENEFIDQVIVFNEDSHEPELDAELSLPKIQLVQHGRRLAFRDLFEFANQQPGGSRFIIANADIFFDDTLARLNGYSLKGRLLCLSRWDVQPDGSARFFEHPSSQDAWIFETPIPPFNCNFHLGLLGCDNRLAWEADNAGLEVSNPGRTVRANHLHLSKIRSYTEQQRLLGPVRAIEASVLETPFPSVLGPPPDAPSAAVAFSEQMGYTIEILQERVSSHNNVQRFFKTIPKTLAGRRFTQVVAYAVSPVAVEFLTAGKIYVLVGNDWYGHLPATEWLNKNGYKEDIALVETEAGTGFEVWSLLAEAGERFVIPTQVLLVADSLIKTAEIHSNRSLPPLNRVPGESIFALTSLSPHQPNPEHTDRCLQSWRRAGLEVRSFNHASEIPELSRLFDIEFVPVAETSIKTFGAHFVPINALLQWAAERDMPALLINADTELRLEPWEMKRIRWLSEGGLCYFVRYNHDGDYVAATREPDGIDAFLLHGRHSALFPQTFLSMGKPYWDYWLPHTFHSRGLPIYAVEFPALFHLRHPNRWSWAEWHKCALEFEKLIGVRHALKSHQACIKRSRRIRSGFDQKRIAISQEPPAMRRYRQESPRPEASPSGRHYLLTEYSDAAALVEQPTLSEILAGLPDFRVVELWRNDVLLENTRFQP
jgi:hypothetical protein